MEALDNPSYFSLPGVSTTLLHASPPSKGTFFLLKRGVMGANTSSAASTSSTSTLLPNAYVTRGSSSAPTTPTSFEASPCPPSLCVPHSPHRRSFRSFLRSHSQNAQLLVLGEPRPSDVAPTCNPTTFKIDHPRNRKKAANKITKSPKSSAELLSNDMVYCPVPQNSQQPRPVDPEPFRSSPDEVFLGKEDARYYNLTAGSPGLTNGRRRHSIGTFFNKERNNTTRSVSSTPTEPSMGDLSQKLNSASINSRSQAVAVKTNKLDSPSSPVADWCNLNEHVRSTHSRRRCNRCSAYKARTADMEDILIVSSKQSNTAALWVNYLTNCFEQISKQHNRAPFKVMSVILEDVVGTSAFPPILEEKMVHVKLQIVIMCPQFLQHIYQYPGPSTALGQLLQPDRVLAMMLGVEEEAVTEQHRAALISYPQWNRLPVKDQDETFVKNFIEVAMNILARVWRQSRPHAEKAHFSLLPKKVKEGQNKVIVLLNDPISKEDKIKITVEKNGDKIDIVTTKRKNPYTLHFQMPDSCLKVSMIANVYVEKNGEQLGCRQVKCESRMRELDQILRSLDDPLLFMCQTLGFSPGDGEHLDNFLVTALQKNIPKHFNLLHIPMVHHHRSHTSNEEYPTLLHFAAKFGLEKLSWQLLECPGGEQACEIRNVCGMTPSEMAEGAGHIKLANALRGYMQMTELTSMYSYLKTMSESKTKPTDLEMTDYHSPRPASETYQIPPSIPRPVTEHYQVPPMARPFTPPTSTSPALVFEEQNIGGYMEMHPSVKTNCSPATSVLKGSIELLNNVSSSVSTSDYQVPRTPSPLVIKNKQLSDQVSLHSSRSEEDRHSTAGSVKKSHEHLSHGPQDELLEIINDFKNNVFTISEVEKLVESWRNRNDVQQSFKEKQEQLTQMRQEYERIQQALKEEMKRPTPFDRIRNFFRGKPKGNKVKENSNAAPPEENKVSGLENIPLCMRPLSSLSLHSTCSSSSSGRMSTVSGCSGVSLGDSGTHSDVEDRKNVPPVTYEGLRAMQRSTGISNYEIPPAPRPIIEEDTNSCQTESTDCCIKDRPPQPVPRPDTPEYLLTVGDDVELGKSGNGTESESSACCQEKSEGNQNETRLEEESNRGRNKTQLPVLKIVEEVLFKDNMQEYMNIPSPDDKSHPNTASEELNVKHATDGTEAVQNDLHNYINVSVPDEISHV